jgi:hypothetical protein
MPNKPKSTVSPAVAPRTRSAAGRLTDDAALAAATRGRAFKKCESCGNSIISTECYCPECARLTSYNMAPAVKQFVPSNDTQSKHSYPSNKHAGYTALTGNPKSPVGKERV